MALPSDCFNGFLMAPQHYQAIGAITASQCRCNFAVRNNIHSHTKKFNSPLPSFENDQYWSSTTILSNVKVTHFVQLTAKNYIWLCNEDAMSMAKQEWHEGTWILSNCNQLLWRLHTCSLVSSTGCITLLKNTTHPRVAGDTNHRMVKIFIS